MGTHGWIEVAYMILASSITMEIGTETFGIRNRRDLVKHMFSTPRPIRDWKQRIKSVLKRVVMLYLCLVMPAVAAGAFFEAYVTDLIFRWFYPT